MQLIFAVLCLLGGVAQGVQAKTCDALVGKITQLSQRVAYQLEDFIAASEQIQTITDPARVCTAMMAMERKGDDARAVAGQVFARCNDIASICSEPYPRALERNCAAVQRRNGNYD